MERGLKQQTKNEIAIRLVTAFVSLAIFASSADANTPSTTAPPTAAPTAPSAAPSTAQPPVAETVVPAVLTPEPINPNEFASPQPVHQLVNESDLWERIRRGFVMGEMVSPAVQQYERYYVEKQDYMKRFVTRGSRYLYHIVGEVERRGLPTEIALLPIIESAFNPQAVSSAKASGMWQFMPKTGNHFGLKQDWHADNRRDVVLSTNAALDYLTRLHRMFNSWDLAFAAYNCGEGCVGRAIAANERAGLPTDFQSLNLPNETKNYVPKLLAVKNLVLSPGSYGIELTAVDNRPYFVRVPAPQKIDVKLAAKLAEMPLDEFSALNPAFNRPVAAGHGTLLVPTESADTFRMNLDLYKSLNGPMVSWVQASARKGERVDAVAKRYGMTPSYFRANSGPFAERKGKFTQSVSFMVPNAKSAAQMNAMLEKKVAIKNGAAPLPASYLTSTASADGLQQIKVKKGETLSAIARRVSMSTDDLRTLNNLADNSVKVGQTLLVPTTGEVEAVATPTVTAEKTSPKKSATKATHYTIRSGDTLSSISSRFNVSMQNLMRWNKLNKGTKLAVGRRLQVSA
jgi:membrane-bound lytic murein transglycosylase D